MARAAVLANVDLLAAILAQVELDPWTFVMCGRVARVWREACRADATLLLKAARSRSFLTKGVFCGLFALTPAEADAYPRGMRAHKTGLMHMYSGQAIGAVMGKVGGMRGWEARLAARAAMQAVFAAAGKRAWVALGPKRLRVHHPISNACCVAH